MKRLPIIIATLFFFCQTEKIVYINSDSYCPYDSNDADTDFAEISDSSSEDDTPYVICPGDEYEFKYYLSGSKEVPGFGTVVAEQLAAIYSDFPKLVSFNGAGLRFFCPAAEEKYISVKITYYLNGRSVLDASDVAEYLEEYEPPYFNISLPSYIFFSESLNYGWNEFIVEVEIPAINKKYSEQIKFFATSTDEICLQWGDWEYNSIKIKENPFVSKKQLRLYPYENSIYLLLRLQGNVENIIYKYSRNSDWQMEKEIKYEDDLPTVNSYRDFHLEPPERISFLNVQNGKLVLNVIEGDETKYAYFDYNLDHDTGFILQDDIGSLHIVQNLLHFILDKDLNIVGKEELFSEGYSIDYQCPYIPDTVNAVLDHTANLHSLNLCGLIFYSNNVPGIWKTNSELLFSEFPYMLVETGQRPKIAARGDRADIFIFDTLNGNGITLMATDYFGTAQAYYKSIYSLDVTKLQAFVDENKKFQEDIKKLYIPPLSQPSIFFDRHGRNYVVFNLYCTEFHLLTNAAGDYQDELVKTIDNCYYKAELASNYDFNLHSETAVAVTDEHQIYVGFYDPTIDSIVIADKKCTKKMSALFTISK